MTVPALAATPPLVQVFKDPNCGCCGAWIDIMADAGYAMDIREATYDDLMRLKVRSGISEDMASCHTARIDGYVIEGHVPPADIHRLLSREARRHWSVCARHAMGITGHGSRERT